MDETPKIVKWPFWVVDLLLMGTAVLIWTEARRPLGAMEAVAIAFCVAAGGFLACVPFVLNYRAVARLAEISGLAGVIEPVRNLPQLAEQISEATGRWHSVQDSADRTCAAANGIVEKVTAEARALAEFMQKVNDSEKSTLRLEVEKLRRVEGEWLQAQVRVMDHVYALYLGAVRSGQPRLVEQLSNFQNACRDSGRRVGLAPFLAETGEPFDPERHQSAAEGDPPAEARVAETLATGYTFQGRILRRVLVRLESRSLTDAS